jgi:hypothetical protein
VSAARLLRCAGCGRAIDECAVCDEPDCEAAVCCDCVAVALGTRMPQPHVHGG